MCMYFHIQGRLFPWRVRVFLKASITTSRPNACTSLYKCMYPFVYVHVAFDVSMQAFGLVCNACVVPAHLFLSVGVCLLGLGRMFFVV